MSDLLNQASLVMVPSGYKEDTVYSVVPSDGSGDLSFTRASNGTRINSAGLVEVTPWNLATDSEDFTSGWPKTATITANTTANPINGAINADTITGLGFIGKNIASIGVNTFFVYAKANSASVIRLNVYDGSTDRGADYNLLTGAISGIYGSPISTNAENVGNGWWKISITTNNANYSYVQIHRDSSGTCYIWGAQLNIGSTAKPYFPTTDRLNVPRLTYQNGGGGCPSLLLEKQSTNLTLYSEQLGNAAWNKINVSVSANQAAAPDGTTSADLIYPTTTGDNRLIEQFFAAGAGQTWTTSFFVKASGFSWVIIYAPTGGGASWFNASTGVFGTIAAGSTAAVLGQVNGFWRISITATLAGTNTYFYAGPADANGSITATANGTNGLLIWGCQLELSSYATSYIPTTSSSATRVADAFALKDITSFSIGNAYTILLDVTMQSSDNNKLFFETRTSTNATSLTARNFNGALRLFNNIDASYPLAAVSSSTNKWVVRINGTSYDLFAVSGGIATKDSATITTARNFGYFELAGSTTQLYFDELVISPTALTDAECQSLVL